MRYNLILMDLDDTLINFKKNEKESFKDTMVMNGVTFTEELFEVYKLINMELWQFLEKGMYTKNEILTLRFDILFAQFELKSDAAQVNHDYLVAMGDHIYFEEGVIDMLQALKGNVTLAIATNGAKLAQDLKLKNSGLGDYFDWVFISDTAGYNKPDIRFFDYVESEVGVIDKDKTLILGDSLTADILGGINYGIDTCWYNSKKIENHSDIQPTFQIGALKEFIDSIQ